MSWRSCLSLWRFFAALVAVSFSLNWLWEMLQMPAYEQMAGRSWKETAFPCALAALGDEAITLATWGLGALAAGQPWWGMKRQWNVYLAAALLGGLISVAFEARALASGRWSYESDRMPVVPLLGVGLWPLLQLILLAPVSLGAAAWWAARRSGER